MKKITLLSLIIFAIVTTNAQNYLISFTGSGASTTVDSVKVENITQCTDITLSGIDTLHLSATVGINELNSSEDNSLHIYPNPNTDNCLIDFIATAQGNATIELYDLYGKRIIQTQELLSKGHQKYRLSGINSGVYFIRIESDKYSYVSKIISKNAIFGTPEIKHVETLPFTDNQNSVSRTENMMSMKSGRSLTDMLYFTGDILKLTGISGNFRTVFMIVPISDQAVTFNFISCTDADSINYPIVQIGTQFWMAENLKTTKYTNGNSIPNISDSAQWSNLTTGAYCEYSNTPDNSNTYGFLYNYFTFDDTLDVCPTGWHVPTDAEWTTLTTYLGGESAAGGKLKDNCASLWQSPNTGATNETGFTALPGGYRIFNGAFNFIELRGYWWSSTPIYTNDAWYRYMFYGSSTTTRSSNNKKNGFSIRCIND